ncbi:MAG: DUF2088 domain-containing protein [Nitrososphaerota archaeon]
MNFSYFNFPKMVEVEQELVSIKIQNIKDEVIKQLKEIDLSSRIKPGSKIAITAGSRGIANIAEIIATIVSEVKRYGGQPFIIPAMGSHGGATPEGQIEVLKSLGITSESVGAPIISSLEVDIIDYLEDDTPIYIDRYAHNADGIIIVNRVKPHTDFKDIIESGLMKMAVIGLGKQKGAEILHSFLSEGYHKILPKIAKKIIEKTKVICGIAIVENGYHETAIIKAIPPEKIEEEEVKLLKIAKEYLPRIPFKDIDLLIIDEIGKDISGVGMDPNVTGRFFVPGEYEPTAPIIKRIVVLDLSSKTEGNAIGIGMADLTTRRVFEKIDFEKTFINCLTSNWPESSKIPIFLPCDRDAIAIGLRAAGVKDPKKAKIVRIKNTLELSKFWISEALIEDIEKNPEIKKKIKIIGEPKDMIFDILGNLAR